MGRRYKGGRKRVIGKNSFTRIEGFEEVQELLQSLADRSTQVYENELERLANDISIRAQRNVNDITYSIADSIRVDKITKKDRVVYRVLAGGPIAPHAHLVEFGHRQITDGQTIYIEGVGFRKLKKDHVVGDVPAHPFLRKAFEQHKTRILSALNKALDKLLKG